MTVFVRYENVVRLLEFLGYRLDESSRDLANGPSRKQLPHEDEIGADSQRARGKQIEADSQRESGTKIGAW